MTRTYQPCSKCQSTGTPTREYPSVNGPMQRLCGTCLDNRQRDYMTEIRAKKLVTQTAQDAQVQRISERVGVAVFDGLLVLVLGGGVALVIWRLLG